MLSLFCHLVKVEGPLTMNIFNKLTDLLLDLAYMYYRCIDICVYTVKIVFIVGDFMGMLDLV